MTAADAFGLSIRIIAFLLVVLGVYEVFYAFLESNGFILDATYTVADHVASGMIRPPLGLLIIVLADRITALAYPPSPD